ncbi:MAG: DNA/RNA non-specific endonuclease [Alistipes sp.]|nr:DNA/RNA non-specific endonuclease [Alistipes sp.]
MKRLLALFVVAALAFAGFGCDDEASLMVDTTPTISVTCNPTINLPSSNATEGTLTYEVVHPIGEVIATAESSASWLRPTISTSLTHTTSTLGYPMVTAKISYKISANKGEAREATLTIRYAGYSSVELTVRQPAGSPEDEGDEGDDNEGDDDGEDDGKGDDPVTPPTPPATGEMDGKYLMVWYINGSHLAATTVKHDSSAPYYVFTLPVTITNHAIAASAVAEAIWTVEASSESGAYTLKASDNCYYAMSTYNSFTAAPALGDSSLTYNWSFTSNGDGTWKIMNTGTSKWIQYDEGHSNIAPSMNAGAMPMLFKLNAAGTAFENIDPVEGGDSGDDVIPTPTGKTLVSGWAELPETLEKAGDYYYTWHITDAKYSNGNKARNYSVCYSKDKMCTMWVAAPMHTFYIKGSHGRTDDYDTDPNFDFTQPGKWSGYTRGHLIASNNRHAGVTSSGLVNRQAFYYSNIAPQLSNFNSGDWGSVDNVMDKQWESRSDTTYAVYGCYWDKANGKEIVSGTKVPTHYYMVMLRAKSGVNKWVVNCSKDELECIAIMMEHKNWDSLPALSTFAMSVADLEQLTGFVYFGNVPNAPKDTYKASSWGL